MAEEISEVAIGYPKSPIVGSSGSVRHDLRPGTHAPRIDALDAARHTAVVVGGPPPALSDPEVAVVTVDESAGYGPAGTLTIVRPDGYVGYVARADDAAGAVERYFDLISAPAGTPRRPPEGRR
jgi:hypothetical protein